MYLKLTSESSLADAVRGYWPEVSDEDLLHDYENVYEWVWLTLRELGIRLNISREHGFDDELDNVVPSQVGAIYVSSFEIDREEFIDEIPQAVVDRITAKHEGRVEIFDGRSNVDEKDGIPIRIIENGREQVVVSNGEERGWFASLWTLFRRRG